MAVLPPAYIYLNSKRLKTNNNNNNNNNHLISILIPFLRWTTTFLAQYQPGVCSTHNLGVGHLALVSQAASWADHTHNWWHSDKTNWARNFLKTFHCRWSQKPENRNNEWTPVKEVDRIRTDGDGFHCFRELFLICAVEVHSTH